MIHWLKTTSFFCIISFLFGCTTVVEHASDRHRLRADQWKELSRYIGDEYLLSGMALTASIVPTEKEGQASLTDFRVEAWPGKNGKVNLLDPQFINLMGCDSDCYRISTLDRKTAIPLSHLTNFFARNEGDLFLLYGKLTNLSEKVALLRKTDPAKFSAYIDWLSSKRKNLDSIRAFSDYLQHAFSTAQYVTYFEGVKTTNSQGNIFLSDNGHTWQDLGDEAALLELWSSANNSGELAAIDEQAGVYTPDETLMLELNHEDSNESSEDVVITINMFDDYKNLPLFVGSTVCTFSDNFFGTIEGIEGKKVTVQLQGQARVLVDGLRMRTASGYLFTEQTDFLFVRVDKTEAFLKTDLAPCEIGIN